MNRNKKIIIVFLLFVTIILAGISAYVAFDLQQPDDTSVAVDYCPPITCPDGRTFPEDNNPVHASCALREQEACQTTGGGGTCPTGGGSCSDRPIGDVIATANGSCSCQLNSSTGLCGCVASAGTTCDIPSEDGLVGTCEGSSVGAACARDNKTGICQAAGVTGSDQRCRCALSGNTTPGDGNGGTDPGGVIGGDGTPNTCSTRTDCNVGYYCSSGKCTAQGGNNAQCGTNNDACVSGNCQGGVCVVAGTSTNSCNPVNNSPCTNGQVCNPNTLLCENPAQANGDCISDAQCATGLVCISLRCRAIVDDSDPNAQCISGKWYCGATAGCTTAGTGKLCNLGSISGQNCTVADACANLTANGALSPNMTCDGLIRLSNGESSRGAFVGCSGRQNCFCAGTSTSVGSAVPSGGTVTCYDDIGNDSCGAGTIVTPAPGGGGGGGGGGSQPVCSQTCSTTCSDGTSCINGVCRNPECPTDSDCQCTTTTNQPYCGDGICQTGELCEAVSVGSNSFYNCSTQALISTCNGIGSSTTPFCYYCGDGIVNGTEQCDYNAPGAENCDTNCTTVSAACISLVENGPDPIRTGAGNVVEYIIQYNNTQTGDPYPNIKLRVGTSGSPVGRDANATSQSLVSPSAKPTTTDNGSVKTYKFVWEAASTAGAAVADGTYSVRVLINGTESQVESASACQESITVNSTAEQETIFTLVKSSAEICTANGDAQISYNVQVSNIGPVTGTINQVTDTLDQDVISAGIVPANINPTYGTYASGVITWVGSQADRTYTAGQTKSFTYTITIPRSLIVNFYQQGIDNRASVTYSDNSSNFELNTPITCNVPTKGTSVTGTVPGTAIFSDSSHYIIFGALLIMTGLIVTKMNSGKYVMSMMSRVSIPGTASNSFERKTLRDLIKKDK